MSVVLPTHDRLEVLPEVLAALGGQIAAPSFEVVVVDDGSTDGTAERLAPIRPAYPLRVLGDDTVPAAGWLGAHRSAHAARGDDPALAVIGYTGWHRRLRPTPFLAYINEHGLQFGYALIADPENVPFNFFYTSNLSLSRAALLAEPFDLRFPYPAWEDIEVAYRLQRRRGMRLVYEPGAVVEHDHPTDLERFARRQEKAGYCAVVFHELHPELGPFLGLGPEGPPPLPSTGRQRLVEGLVRALQDLPVKLPRWWDEALRYHYIRGLHRGWLERRLTREGETRS